MTSVSIVGAGYVGLVTGACLAELGHRVICVDRDHHRIEEIQQGRVPFFETGLTELLERNLESSLSATTDLEEAVAATEVTLLAVGTPYGPAGIDLSAVRDATEAVGNALSTKAGFHVVGVKSTVVPGTTDTVLSPLLERSSGRDAGVDFGVVVNPEFLTEGQAVADFMEPDRIIIGASDRRSEEVMAGIYGVFPKQLIMLTNPRTAEMIKYASNALLATLISFTNEVANLGAAIGGIDTVDVMQGVHSSRYLTTRCSDGETVAEIASFLAAGCGFGGSCLPKDVASLTAQGRSLGVPMPVLEAVLEVNERQPSVLVELVRSGLGSLRGAKVAVLGLAFKPDTSDIRESPALAVIDHLAGFGAEVVVHDPVVRPGDLPKHYAFLVDFRPQLEAAVSGVDAVVIVTRWNEYRRLPELLAKMTPAPLLVDGRRLLAADSVARYAGIGR